MIGRIAQSFGEALASQEQGRILRARAKVKELLERLEEGLSLEGLLYSDQLDDEDDEDNQDYDDQDGDQDE